MQAGSQCNILTDHLSSQVDIMADAGTLERIRADLSKVKVPTSYSKIYKDECMFTFATPESEGGLFVNLNSWHGVGSRFLALDHERSGNVLYFNLKHKRVPLPDEEMTNGSSAPKKMKLGGEDGFQVDKKNYTIEKTTCLVLMPDRKIIELPCPELPELVLNAIAAIEVSARVAAPPQFHACCTKHVSGSNVAYDRCSCVRVRLAQRPALFQSKNGQTALERCNVGR